MRRGRIRHGARLVRRDKRITLACAISIFLLIGLAAKEAIEYRRREARLNSQISQGEAYDRPDFGQWRGYIRYQVAKSGRTSWLGPIAQRFQVTEGWRKIAEVTLQAKGEKPDQAEIDAFQFRVDIGTEIRIPLL
jgi:hypothetical protein